METKWLAISNGNDGQIPFLLGMYQTLFSPAFGAFTGDFLFLSDKLSQTSETILKKNKLPYLLLDPLIVNRWQTFLSSETHALGKVGKPLFLQYAISTFGQDYTHILYIDPDILFQKPINPILNSYSTPGVYYSAQSDPTLQTRWPRMQLERAVTNGHLAESQLYEFAPEINTGFMFGDIPLFTSFINDLLSFMTTPPFNRYLNSDKDSALKNAWHDQDYFRCFLRINENYRKIHIIDSAYVKHLCNNIFEEYKTCDQQHVLCNRNDESIPPIIHYAGGTWVHFLQVSVFYFGLFTGFSPWLINKMRLLTKKIRIFGKQAYKAFRRKVIRVRNALFSFVRRTYYKYKENFLRNKQRVYNILRRIKRKIGNR